VAGPFGPRDLLGFDRSYPAEDGGALAERYDLGPTRGEQPTRSLESRGCRTHLGGGALNEGGTFYAQASVEVPEKGRYVLRLETPNSVQVFVDGESAFRLDARQRPVQRVTLHPLELSGGQHRITVKVTTRHPNPVMLFALTRPDGKTPGNGAMGGGGPAVTVDAADADADAGPLERYVRASIAKARGDMVGVREQLRGTEIKGGATPVLTLRATAALNDPLRSGEMRRDLARQLLRAVEKEDPQAWQPTVQLARLEAADGQVVAAIERLRGAGEQWPKLATIPLSLAELLIKRGWEGQAAEAAERAREILPDACPPMRAQLKLARRRKRTGRIDELTRALVECNARSNARMTELVRQRRWDAAAEELERLAGLEPHQSRAQVLSHRLRIARGKNDTKAIREILRELTGEKPRSDTLALSHADEMFARQGPQKARQVLDQAIDRSPADMARLRWVREAIGGKSVLGRWRVDGRKVLERFESSGRSYDAPQVLVFDYTVIRVFEDGSALELTHNIYKLRSERAVDRQGEYEPPGNARMLTLHTIKEDGRRIEPDVIEGKKTLSLPDLSPGDYIEYEYVRKHEQPRGFPGGAIGDRFYFRSFEIPFDRSELTVIAPEGDEVVVDPRGPAPKAERTNRDGLQVLHWKVTGSEPLTREPMSVPAREWVPSVNWGIGATWERFVEGIRDVLADRSKHDPAAVRLAERVAGDAEGKVQAARALYYWVLEHVENNNNVFGQAASMLAQRTGNRARVLHYLYRLAGIESDLVLARDARTDQTRSRLADDSTYDHLLVRLRTDEGPRFVSTNQRGAPFGFLSPVLRGQDGLVLNSGATRVELPKTRKGQDRRSIRADVALESDGSARVEVVETFRGTGAVGWRKQLEGIAPATLEQRFGQQYVARLASGAQLRKLDVTALDNPEEPLMLQYTFEVPRLARKQGDRWRMSPLFPTNLARVYARTNERRTAQLIAPPVDVEVVTRIEVPDGGRVVGVPKSTQFEEFGASFQMKTVREERTARMERNVRIPMARLPPQEYPDFARFCRRASQAESREIALSL
jgi:tetratricopeptide (TPR) repeat protein